MSETPPTYRTKRAPGAPKPAPVFVGCEIPHSTHKRLAAHAKRNHRSIAATIRRFIAQGLDSAAL